MLIAVRKLEEVIERVVSAAKAMKERIDRLMERMERSREKNSAIKTDTDPIIDNVTHPKEGAGRSVVKSYGTVTAGFQNLTFE